MYFSTAKPVIGQGFYNRRLEVEQLFGVVASLKAGVPRYCAVLGLRKVGKSSLLQEFTRRTAEIADVVIAIVDCSESCVDANTFFEDVATAVIDEFLIKTGHAGETGLLNGVKGDDASLTMTAGRIQALSIDALNKGLSTMLEVRKNGESLRSQYRSIIDLPEMLASETGKNFIVVFDGFQECARLNPQRKVKTTIGNVFQFLRARWQGHERVAYLISGSEITLLEKMIQEESSPFFQHFNPMTVAEFSRPEAQEMFAALLEKSEYTMAEELLSELVQLTNGHPFYLQVLGEELCKASPETEIQRDTYKAVVQQTLFESAGRLSLYFAGQHTKHIKTSTSLEKTLVSISEGHHRVSEISKDLGQLTGQVSSFISRLVEMDILVKVNDTYQYRDPVFELWIAGTKSHLKSAIGPYTLGNQVEKAVANKLAKEGFSLVYQSKASRGVFDLLAILNSFMIGLQVKKATQFPFYLSKDEFAKMRAWGERLNWLPILCVYIGDNHLCFFPLEALSETDKSMRADESAGKERLLDLVVKPRQ